MHYFTPDKEINRVPETFRSLYRTFPRECR